MNPTREQLRQKIVILVADALDRDVAEVSPHASLIDDLGAESIDFLDLQFRIESDFGLKFTDDELWRGSFEPTDPRWVAGGRLTPAAVEQVRRRQPDFAWERFADRHRRRRPAAPAHRRYHRRPSRAPLGAGPRSAGRLSARRRVVVTGMGVVSPLGHEVEPLWRGLAAGRSAVGPIRRFDAAGYPTRIAAESPNRSARRRSRPASGGPRAGSNASPSPRRAPRSPTPVSRRRATASAPANVSAWLGGGTRVVLPPRSLRPLRARRSRRTRLRRGALRRRVRPRISVRAPPSAAAPATSRRDSPTSSALAGPLLAVDTACAAGTQALGDAARWIRRGLADAVVAVASDSQLAPLGLASFCLLRVLSTRNDDPARASRPFAAGRDGFVMGEGAGALVLEALESAERRGAPVYAEIAGFGSACDAYRVTDPHPDGLGAALAMQRALADAGVEPAEVGYVNAHGTSTPANDRLESRAIHRVFAARRDSRRSRPPSR